MQISQYDHETNEERRVLIIDDDVDFVEAQAELIEDKGYIVRYAYNSYQAKEIITDYDAQIAIIDQRLGNEDGVDLINGFKQIRPNMFCIVLTGFAEMDSVVKALRNGANDYLCKPIEPEILLAVLERCFEAYRMRLIAEAAIAAKQVADAENRAKSVFLSQMSHEFRTPLTTILGYAELLLTDTDTDTFLSQEQKLNLHVIKKAGYHLLDLVNKLLDLSRIESGHIELNIENVTVNEVIDECIVLTKTLAKQKNVVLQRTNPANYTIQVDRIQFKQIILNLLSNSAKYAYQFSNVEVDCKPCGAYRLKVSVTDKGPGLSEEQQANIFAPFDRLGAESTEVDGVGIGLVITKHLVESMDGTIGLSSIPGVGSTFWIEFPMVEEGNINASKTEHSTNIENEISPTIESKNAKGPKILLVEDNYSNQQLLVEQLKRIDCSTIVAVNGKQALEIIETESFDIILTDCNMPEMDGFELSRVIREREKKFGGYTPILAITADALTGIEEKCQHSGMDDFLTKPFVIKDLRKFIGKWSIKGKLPVIKN